jgi:hypothetical protein
MTHLRKFITVASHSPTQVVGVYRLASPLAFEAACAGRSVTTCIGDYDARITLPELDTTRAFPNVRAPTDVRTPPAVMAELLDSRPGLSWLVPRWGTVLTYNQDRSAKDILVTDVFIEYEAGAHVDVAVEVTADGRRILPDALFLSEHFGEIDPWFDRVASWVSLLSGHPIDVSGRIKGSTTDGERLAVAIRDEAGHTLPLAAEWASRAPHEFDPLAWDTWQRAVQLGADPFQLPPALRLVVEATTALHLGDHRLSVIQAATAMELALSLRLSRDIDALGSPVAAALSMERRTLGTLVSSLGDAYALPAMSKRVVSLRNRAIHSDGAPTREEARAVLETVRAVVAASPLSEYF